MLGAMRSLRRDASVVNQKVKPGTAKRMLRFAAPYTGLLALFLFVVLVDAAVGIANPLIYRSIINNGILKGNASLIIRLAILVGILGVVDSALGLAQSYLSSLIGARIVLSLRTKLFEHIQQMPLAFFTRAQTGALVSRLNNDVSGAQSAFTDILSNVVGNIVTVALILGAMFVLSWRITLASLILLPLFLFPARFWGRKLQAITRESYDLGSEMNSLMIERFNVAGAQLAKLFGRREDENKAFEAKAARVSDISVKRTIYSRLFLYGADADGLFCKRARLWLGRRARRAAQAGCRHRGGSRFVSGAALWPADGAIEYSSERDDGARFLRARFRSARSAADDS